MATITLTTEEYAELRAARDAICYISGVVKTPPKDKAEAYGMLRLITRKVQEAK